jgi:hypothetical protein
VCGLFQVRVDIVLELSDQKARVFLILIAFTMWFSEHAHKIFDKIPVRN